MDYCFMGTMWRTFILLIWPYLADTLTCPNSCVCHSEGVVKCVGWSITDVPKQMPSQMILLQLNDTKMNVINEHSLSNKSLLLRFSLTYSHLHTIHPRAFYVAPQLRSVKLSFNDLSSLPARVFSPLDSLEQLHLDGNQFETISAENFTGLTGLIDLDLRSNKISSLDANVFNGLTSLIHLNLGRNSISELPPRIFHSLTLLHQLHLYNNQLEVLTADIFSQLTHLEELKIHHNRISRLPPEMFWSLRKLKILTLSNNLLQAVPEKSFYNMLMLSKLTLYNNPLLSLPDMLMGYMPKLVEFYLFGTNLTTVPGNLFANMTNLLRLNFHLNSQLRELPPELFWGLPKLQKLSLRSNDLHQLHPDQFSGLTTLAMLYLHNNTLRTLPNTIFQNLSAVSTIDLRYNKLKSLPGDIFLSNRLMGLTLMGNPWDCTCEIRGLVKWIRKNERVVLDREDVMCHSPTYHRLRRVGSLLDEEFYICDTNTVRSHFHIQYHRPDQTETATTPSMKPLKSQPGIPTTATTANAPSSSPLLSTLPSSDRLLNSIKTSTTDHPSPPFYDMLVVEQGSEFVHHNHYQGWVYLWTLRLDGAFAGFLVTCHILLVATGVLLIFAAMYGMCRLNKAMRELNVECEDNLEAKESRTSGQI